MVYLSGLKSLSIKLTYGCTNDKYNMKYGILKYCLHCNKQFETKPRFVDYCSTPCKNPINRPGCDAWNKGITLTEDQKSKQNTAGLQKGHGWNKGKPNEVARQRMLTNNPNKDGKANNKRPKKTPDTALSIYKSNVRKATYRTIKEIRLSGEFVPQFGKHKTDLQIDHIVPYKQGFDLGIPAEILGGKRNIQFLKGADNRAKWDAYQPMHVIRFIKGGINGLFETSN